MAHLPMSRKRPALAGMPQNHYDMGVAVGDYDNDGFEDIYITGFGGNTLYHNNGNGTFTDVTKAAGVSGRWMERERRDFSTTTTMASSTCSSPAT